MSVTLPLDSALPHYAFQTSLDGVSYGFELFWNDVAEGWFVSLFDSNGDPIVNSVRLVVDFPLLARYASAGKPPGLLIAQDTTGRHQDPGRDDLGTRCLLLYFSATDPVVAGA